MCALPVQVYLRSHSNLRDDMREWRSALQALFEATPLAARMLLALAASDNLAAFSQALGLGNHMRELAPHFLENFITRNEQVQPLYIYLYVYMYAAFLISCLGSGHTIVQGKYSPSWTCLLPLPLKSSVCNSIPPSCPSCMHSSRS